MSAAGMTETQAVNLVRNTLLVAGEEMGHDGDHWPVIKSTIYSIMKDWEDLQVERNVFAEVKAQYGSILARVEKNLELCAPDLRPEAEKIVKRMRESYDACFSETAMTMFVVCDEDVPIHIRRAENIARILEDDNA